MNTKKSIAFITFATLPLPAVRGGAVETLIDNICNQNEEDNSLHIDVYSIFDEDAIAAASCFKNTNYIYYYGSKNKRFSFKNIIFKVTGISIPDKTMKSIVKKINAKNYDAIYITSIFRELYYIVKMIKNKVVWYLHADALTVLPSKTCKKIGDKCAAIVSVSDFVGNQIKECGCRVPVYTVKNCADICPINKSDRKKERKDFLRKHGIPVDNNIFLYVGRINPIKGIKELVKAFLAVDIKNISLIIVGEPQNPIEREYLESIKTIADARVVFIGYVKHSELPNVYNACDVLVVPSICNEAAGLVILEAQMCGKYIIATNRGGIPEYVTNQASLIDTDNNFEDNLMEAMKNFIHSQRGKNIEEFIVRTQRELYVDFISTLNKIIEIE